MVSEEKRNVLQNDLKGVNRGENGLNDNGWVRGQNGNSGKLQVRYKM